MEFMKKDEHLFFLIKSMTKSEKRSFKLFSKQYLKEGDNNYVLVFDVIEKMDVFSQKNLLEELSPRVKQVNIPMLKVQLNDSILKSLRQNSARLNRSLALMQNMDFIDILFEKNLIDQAKVIHSKTMNMALKNLDYLALDRLSLQEYNINVDTFSKDDLNHYINETSVLVQETRLENIMLAKLKLLDSRIRHELLKDHRLLKRETLTEIDSIVQDPIFLAEPTDLPILCQVEYHAIKGHYYYALRNGQKSYYHRKEVVRILTEIGAEDRVLANHIRLLFHACGQFQLFEEFDEELIELSDTLNYLKENNRNYNYQRRMIEILNNIKIHRDVSRNDFTKIQTYLEEMENTPINLYSNANIRLTAYTNYCIAQFGNQNYKMALKWANKILNDLEFKNIRSDINCHMRILNICIHYKMENYGLVKSLVKSAKRYLENNDYMVGYNLAFLSFANKYFTSAFKQEWESEFIRETERWEVLYSTPDGKAVLNSINLILWLKSSYKGTSIQEEARQSALQLNPMKLVHS